MISSLKPWRALPRRFFERAIAWGQHIAESAIPQPFEPCFARTNHLSRPAGRGRRRGAAPGEGHAPQTGEASAVANRPLTPPSPRERGEGVRDSAIRLRRFATLCNKVPGTGRPSPDRSCGMLTEDRSGNFFIDKIVEMF